MQLPIGIRNYVPANLYNLPEHLMLHLLQQMSRFEICITKNDGTNLLRWSRIGKSSVSKLDLPIPVQALWPLTAHKH